MAVNVSVSPGSDLEEAEAVVVLLALFLLQSDDQLFDLIRPGLCDQRLRLLDLCQQLLWARPACGNDIFTHGLFLVTNYVLLCFAPGLLAMVFLQVNYAVVTSTEVAYLSYIYSVIPIENYQRATGYLRSAMLVGYTFGASLAQVLVSVAGRAFTDKTEEQ
ncbi:hypothetical protein F7725_021068 [Dissostichus mawsoni]|uniref:Uncharacterized protein n=1 Tax=Dissostichus mawsoni TaxID=36200 RepID=A0A7J5YF40_DISMA|nr:hypothetical protein F7725_021068 [Dissostichus mawsoni]